MIGAAAATERSYIMRPHVDANLVAGWIALTHSDSGTPEHDQHFWTFDRVWEMCNSDPESAWQFILAVLETDRSGSDYAKPVRRTA